MISIWVVLYFKFNDVYLNESLITSTILNIITKTFLIFTAAKPVFIAKMIFKNLEHDYRKCFYKQKSCHLISTNYYKMHYAFISFWQYQ